MERMAFRAQSIVADVALAALAFALAYLVAASGARALDLTDVPALSLVQLTVLYAALAGDKDAVTLDVVAGLYAQGHNAIYRVYSRIQWDLLDAHIQAIRGQEGLDYVRRKALLQQ